MSGNNAFFKYGDISVLDIFGYRIDPVWWSRRYEYPWALRFAHNGETVADMGCGWMQRPLKDALATVCEKVYAIDANEEVLKLDRAANVEFIVADFTHDSGLPDASMDKIFCVSVLEDLGDMVEDALREFARVLKPTGRIVITCDSQYDDEKPLGKYPGVNMDKFMQAVASAHLEFDGEVNLDRTDAVHNPGFNLCCFHCVLKLEDK